MADVTAKQIAQRLGISASAVSLALHGKPGVSSRTREQVLETALQMGYSPPARTAATGKKAVCYMIYVDPVVSIAEYSTFSSCVLQGVESAASALGYQTMIRYLRADGPLEAQAADILPSVDGIILLGTDITDACVPQLEKFLHAVDGVPVVVADSFLLSSRTDCVGSDGFAGAKQAAEYLLSRGNRSIGYLRSNQRIQNFDEREAGLRAALRQAGLEPASVIDLRISPEGAFADFSAWLDSGKPLPDALFAENDIVAAAALRALKSRGIDVPGRISVMGFDDVAICKMTDPPMTTVRLSKEQLGAVAMQLIHQRLHHTPGMAGPSHMKIALSTELCIRGSVR